VDEGGWVCHFVVRDCVRMEGDIGEDSQLRYESVRLAPTPVCTCSSIPKIKAVEQWSFMWWGICLVSPTRVFALLLCCVRRAIS